MSVHQELPNELLQLLDAMGTNIISHFEAVNFVISGDISGLAHEMARNIVRVKEWTPELTLYLEGYIFSWLKQIEYANEEEENQESANRQV